MCGKRVCTVVSLEIFELRENAFVKKTGEVLAL